MSCAPILVDRLRYRPDLWNLKMTSKWRLAILLLVILTGCLTRGLWAPSIGRSLVCTEEVASTEAILVENFDPDYRLFERAAALQQAGLPARVLVPTQADERDSELVANPISRGIAELMARHARVQNPEIIPIQEIEPYSLNAAYQIREFLTKERLRSVLVVAPAFRSRRSSLVYHAALRPTGIQVYCLPVFGDHTPENWTATWHGMQGVTEQFMKLQYYRFYVLRSRLRPQKPDRDNGAGRSRSCRPGAAGDRQRTPVRRPPGIESSRPEHGPPSSSRSFDGPPEAIDRRDDGVHV